MTIHTLQEGCSHATIGTHKQAIQQYAIVVEWLLRLVGRHGYSCDVSRKLLSLPTKKETLHHG